MEEEAEKGRAPKEMLAAAMLSFLKSGAASETPDGLRAMADAAEAFYAMPD